MSRIPPTQLVDCSYSAYKRAPAALLCRLSMNDPPTALVGFQPGSSQPRCRLSMNDPPTALVGFAEVQFVRSTFQTDADRVLIFRPPDIGSSLCNDALYAATAAALRETPSAQCTYTPPRAACLVMNATTASN